MLFIYNFALASCTYTCKHTLLNTELIMYKLEEYKNHFDYLLFNSNIQFYIPPSSPPGPLPPPISEYLVEENHSNNNLSEIFLSMILFLISILIMYLFCGFYISFCYSRRYQLM